MLITETAVLPLTTVTSENLLLLYVDRQGAKRPEAPPQLLGKWLSAIGNFIPLLIIM